jgi:hypothetical protein
MSLETDVAQLLVNSDLVGDRVYPMTLPQQVTLPAIRYQRIDSPGEVSHSGGAGLEHPRMQVSIHALTFGEAEQLADALKRLLHGRRGLFGVGSAAFVANDVPDFEEETGQYLRYVDVIVWHHWE